MLRPVTAENRNVVAPSMCVCLPSHEAVLAGSCRCPCRDMCMLDQTCQTLVLRSCTCYMGSAIVICMSSPSNAVQPNLPRKGEMTRWCIEHALPRLVQCRHPVHQQSATPQNRCHGCCTADTAVAAVCTTATRWHLVSADSKRARLPASLSCEAQTATAGDLGCIVGRIRAAPHGIQRTQAR